MGLTLEVCGWGILAVARPNNRTSQSISLVS